MATRPLGRKLANPTLTRRQVQALDLAEKQQEVRDWIERVLGEPLPAGSSDGGGDGGMHAALGDGVAICRVLNAMFPGIVARVNPPDSLPFKLRENIAKFLAVAEKLGVPDAARFQVDDLFEAKNMRLVYTTLQSLAEMAEGRGYAVRWQPLRPAPEPQLPPAKPKPVPVQHVQPVQQQRSPAEDKLRRILESISGNDQGLQAVHVAVQGEDTLDVVDLLLKHRQQDAASRDRLGNTPLHVAVMHECMGAVERLLRAGAEPSPANGDGDTPLHLAVARNVPLITDRLLAAGANVRAANKHGTTPLHAAVAEGNEDAVVKLLAKGADVHAADADGNTALHVAAIEGHRRIAEILIQHGALRSAVNRDGNTPLMLAAGRGDPELIRVLTEPGCINRANKAGQTPIHAAVLRGNVPAVRLLIELGADVNAKDARGETPLIVATKKDNAQLVELLTQHGAVLDATRTEDGWSALYTASYNGNEPTVAFLLKRGASVKLQNLEGWTPLHAAASRGHLPIVKLLIEFKAVVNAQSKQGTTPLYHAVASNRGDVARFLIGSGADVDLGAPGSWRPIHIAAYNDHPDMIKLLLAAHCELNVPNREVKGYMPVHIVIAGKTVRLESLAMMLDAGADINSVNENGQTPLHLAVFWNKLDVVRMLLQRGGINLRAKNSKGRTPLDLACHFGYQDVAKLLAVKMGVPTPAMKKHEPTCVTVGTPQAPPKPDDFYRGMSPRK